MSSEASTPILLGIASRAVKRGPVVDLLGATTLPLLAFYPQKLHGLVLLLAIPALDSLRGTQSRIVMTDVDRPDFKGWIDLHIPDEPRIEGTPGPPLDAIFSETLRFLHESKPSSADDPVYFLSPPRGTHFFVPTCCPPLFLCEPTRVLVTWEFEGRTHVLGELAFGFRAEHPIEDDERRALLANPEQHRVIAFNVECTRCEDSLRLYETLDDSLIDRNDLAERTLLRTAADDWQCNCKRTSVTLKWLKQAIPTLFRSSGTILTGTNLEFASPYRAARLQVAVSEFRSLTRGDSAEEPIQQFLQSNPVFWHFLSPKRILHKPRILTSSVADFGVVSATQTLYLIEIEKPHTKLVTKAGGKSAEVQKAFDQIRDWRRCIEQHRHAVLSEMGVTDREARSIRYIVIAGADSDEGSSIRAEPLADTSFLTFEELAAQVALLAATMESL